MPRKRSTRVYTRTRNGVTRYYGDFRDLGGGQEALIPSGETGATTDADIAAELASHRVKELRAQAKGRILDGIERRMTLKAYGAHHLKEKAKAGKTVERHMKQLESRLRTAGAFFGDDRDVATITVADVQAFAHHLSKLPGRRPKTTLAPGSVRHYLNALSGLYRRAQSDGVVPVGYNPVAALVDKPVAVKHEARWLEVHDAALLLEAARLSVPVEPEKQTHGGTISAKPFRYPYALLGTFLLTGGRRSEVLGLEVDDVSFKRKTVTFRPNRWRNLKTATSHRVVPLWPQLEDILRAYLLERERHDPLGALLFPSSRPKDGNERMVYDLRKALDQVGARAGFPAGELRLHGLRHTYCAASLQLVDRGAPVSPFTVARWMGHGGDSLVKRLYGHLGEVRHRSEVLEFRVEQHETQLRDRLTDVRRDLLGDRPHIR